MQSNQKEQGSLIISDDAALSKETKQPYQNGQKVSDDKAALSLVIRQGSQKGQGSLIENDDVLKKDIKKDNKIKKERGREDKPIDKIAAAKAATLVRVETFKQSIMPYVEVYTSKMLNDFFSYWTEPTRNGAKVRFETEKTWDVSRRLARWSNGVKDNNPKKQGELNEKVGKMQQIAENAARALEMIGDE